MSIKNNIRGGALAALIMGSVYSLPTTAHASWIDEATFGPKSYNPQTVTRQHQTAVAESGTDVARAPANQGILETVLGDWEWTIDDAFAQGNYGEGFVGWLPDFLRDTVVKRPVNLIWNLPQDSYNTVIENVGVLGLPAFPVVYVVKLLTGTVKHIAENPIEAVTHAGAYAGIGFAIDSALDSNGGGGRGGAGGLGMGGL